MAVSATLNETDLTLADLLERFGPMPFYRIRQDPPPGTATEQDVLDADDREDRLCELIDGVLVQKTAGFMESIVAVRLATALVEFDCRNERGIVLGANGAVRLAPGQVRMPDAAFYSWDRFPRGRIAREPIPDLVPDLAVEVLSKYNTKKEMDRKLEDYFTAGVHTVWYVDPDKRTVQVFSSPEQSTVLKEKDVLEGGAVLPGFSVPVAELFRESEPPKATKSG